jgi:threonine/homoserine/homoserine lactone efflux protein
MPFSLLLIQGVLIGIVVAVPVGPLGLLCVNRALVLGALCGLVSGLGVASADALAAGIAALGITLISGFLLAHQVALRLLGGLFLCYLGYKTYRPRSQPLPGNVNGLLSAYATTFVLTFSNPVTILSFVAIYAGWGVESLQGHYVGAAVLSLGVFLGSALWWLLIFAGLSLFRDLFTTRVLATVHKVSGTVIAGFGLILLLSLTPLEAALRNSLFWLTARHYSLKHTKDRQDWESLSFRFVLFARLPVEPCTEPSMAAGRAGAASSTSSASYQLNALNSAQPLAARQRVFDEVVNVVKSNFIDARKNFEHPRRL